MRGRSSASRSIWACARTVSTSGSRQATSPRVSLCRHATRTSDQAFHRGTTSTRGSARPSTCSATAAPRSSSSVGRYNQLSRSDFTGRFHPFNSSINTAFRNWTDSNNNYIPDCDVQNFVATGSQRERRRHLRPDQQRELRDSSIPRRSSSTTPAVTENRDYLWDINIDLQHEIVHGLSVDVGYNHNWDGNFTVTENTAARLRPSYDEFCITVPNDPRLPNAGQQRCGFYDVKPQLFRPGHAARDECQGICRQERQHETAATLLGRRLDQRRTDAAAQHRDRRRRRRRSSTSTITASRWTSPISRYDITGTTGATTWNTLQLHRRRRSAAS